MKTPREVLLARHQAAERKLDDVRREALNGLSPKEKHRGSYINNFVAAFLDLFRLPRWAWGGLAAAWCVIVGLNIAARESSPATAVPFTVAERSSDTLEALREQKQLFAELVGLRPETSDADVPRFVPRPRSSRSEPTACA